ncbi:MAG: hypothetical protein IJ468_07940 [Lachnospiraceae bacterium]|nr:hypothetical protein [Lachnospiraceae bacterium]
MKRNRLLTCLFLCGFLALVLTGCTTGRIMSYSYSGSVIVTVGMGTRAPYTPGKLVPVSIQVSGDYADSGHQVTVTVPTSERDFYCYQKQLTDEPSQKIEMAVPVSPDSRQMVVEVVNARGNVVYSRTCSYQFADLDTKAGEILVGLVGVTSETDIWNFPYSYNDTHFQVRAVSIEPRNLLGIQEAYDSYSLLVLSVNAVNSMTREQKEGISSWVEQGGCVLLLGSRSTAQELGLDTGNRIESVSFAEDAHVNGYAVERGFLWLMIPRVFEMQFTESEQITLLEILLNERLLQSVNQVQNTRKLESVVTDALDSQENVTEVADLGIYFTIFAVYLLVVLPGVWLFLRRKDRLSLFRMFVCTAAVAVCALIWFVGSKTRFSEPFLHSITIRDYSGTTVRRTTFFSVQAPSNYGYEISLLPGYEIKPLQREESWSEDYYDQYSRHTAEILHSPDEIRLRMDNLIAFASRYFMMTNEEPCEEKLTGQVVWGTETVTGMFTNQLSCDLSQVLIQAGNSVFLLDEWKAGESFDLEEACDAETCQKVSLELFLEGSYRHPSGWDMTYSRLYEIMTRQKAGFGKDGIFVMGLAPQDGSIQMKTAYEQDAVSFIMAQVITE